MQASSIIESNGFKLNFKSNAELNLSFKSSKPLDYS